MRLTLRTLLAYLDGILEPNDAQDISKKVAESDYATGLVHRIGDVMRRLRLSAPSVDDRTPSLDPNSVAEYLDNTLLNDQVADFEKVCLESDVHLAEVASCHQVLTLVLGEPAEIDPKSRQRMYQLPEQQNLEASSVTSLPVNPPKISVSTDVPSLPNRSPMPGDSAVGVSSVVGSSDDEEANAHKNHPKPMVPEYLREIKKGPSTASIVVVVLLLVFLAATVLYSTGQLSPGTPGGNLLVRCGLLEPNPEAAAKMDVPQTSETGASAASTSTPDLKGSPQTTASESPASNLPPTASSANTASNTATGVTSSLDTPAVPDKPLTGKAPEGTAAQPSANPPEGKVSQGGDKAQGEGNAGDLAKSNVEGAVPSVSPKLETPEALPDKTAAIEKPGVAVASKDPAASTPDSDSASASARPALTSKPDKASEASESGAAERANPPGASVAIKEDGKADDKADDKTGVKPDAKTDETPAESAGASPEALARLISSDQVLLKNIRENEWIRVAANQMLYGDRLLVIPTYRAKLSLTVSMALLEMLGGTQIDLLGDDPREIAGVRIHFGRMVAMPLGKAGTRLRIVFDGRSGVLTFNEAGSMAAMVVRRIHTPGENPETEPPRYTTELLAANGSLLWEEGTKEGVQIPSGSRLNFDGDTTVGPSSIKELPDWIQKAESLKPWDKFATSPIAKGLPTERSARVGLMEMADQTQKRREIQSLALRSLTYLGEYQSIVAALNDTANKLIWSDYIEYLRDAVTRDPDSAKAVRQALEKQYPSQAERLYRMLWGYTNESLEKGEDADLVKALEDENLPVRLLSSWNLRDITGQGGWVYRPEETAAKRQAGLQGWRTRLDKKQIRYKSTEEKTPAAREKPAAAAEPKPDLP